MKIRILAPLPPSYFTSTSYSLERTDLATFNKIEIEQIDFSSL